MAIKRLMYVFKDLPYSNFAYCIKGFREDSLLAHTAMNLCKFMPTKDHVVYLPFREALQGQSLNIF